MSLSAILVTNACYSPFFPSVGLGPSESRTPFACMEIFGRPIIERIGDRCREAATMPISMVADSAIFRSTNGIDMSVAITQNDRWLLTRAMLEKHFQHGIRTTLIAEIGAYVEFDLVEALRFHQARQQPVTPLHDAVGFLGYALVDVVAALSDKNFGFPINAAACAENCQPYIVQGHVNRLANAKALRRLVIDSFLGRSSIHPQGKQVKPGVWVDAGARVHRMARLVAPAYVGRNTQVQATAVVSSFSNLERDCRVGGGSVIANASLLPHTFIGADLDIADAVVDGSELTDVERNISLKIEDPKLISDAAPRRSPSKTTPSSTESPDDVIPPALEPDYSQYLSRRASRVFEVFRGEV